MNDSNDPNQTIPQASAQDPAKPIAFCQNCGKPLHRETIRVVGPAVYCEPCLAARLAGAPSTAAGWRANPTAAGSAPGYVPVDANASYAPNAFSSGEPNPGLAALLGFIPGVGAMYNEQYGKGIIHLIVFATLISLTNANGLFGLFIAGWVFYMVIEAHHTARARRDGTPLPNPFGLNDIGERLGFGRAWPVGPSVAGVARDATQGVPTGHAGSVAPPPFTPSPGAGNWGAPGYSPTYPAPPSPPPYAYQNVPPSGVAPPLPRNRFPAGAVWLIGLGTIFLLSTTGIFHGFPAAVVVGFALIGLGIWIFLSKMGDSGAGMQSDGTPAYGFQLLRAIRSSVWLVLVGVLFLLNAFNLVTWHRSWPLFIILAGVLALLERSTYNAAASQAFQAAPAVSPIPDTRHTAAAPPAMAVALYPHEGRGGDEFPSTPPRQGGN